MKEAPSTFAEAAKIAAGLSVFYLWAPLAVTMFLVTRDPLVIVLAFGAWISLLVAWGISQTSNWDEGLGWSAIFAMFFSTPAVPGIAFLIEMIVKPGP